MFAGGSTTSTSGGGGGATAATGQPSHAPPPPPQAPSARSPSNGRQPSPAGYLAGYHSYHGQSHHHSAAAAAAAAGYGPQADAYHGMYPSAMDPAMAWHAAAYSAGAAHLYGRAGTYADALAEASVWSQPQLNHSTTIEGEFSAHHYATTQPSTAAICNSNNDNHLGRDSGSVSPPHHPHAQSLPPPPPPPPHQELKPKTSNQTHSSPDSGLTDSGSGSPSAASAASHLGYLTAAGGAAAAAAAAAAIASSLGNSCSAANGSGRGVDSEAPSGASGSAASRPQPVRSPYEWMKRPNFNTKSSAKEGNIVPGSRTRTKDKYRVVYSDHQRLELEKEFHYSRYITIRRKSELAQGLNLSERQVKIWFQNRRAKERKHMKKRDELMHKEKMDVAASLHAQASQMAAFQMPPMLHPAHVPVMSAASALSHL